MFCRLSFQDQTSLRSLFFLTACPWARAKESKGQPFEALEQAGSSSWPSCVDSQFNVIWHTEFTYDVTCIYDV